MVELGEPWPLCREGLHGELLAEREFLERESNARAQDGARGGEERSEEESLEFSRPRSAIRMRESPSSM